jgi:replicative DNA helicase
MSQDCQSIEGEMGLLGSILIDPGRVMALCADVGITHEAFASEPNSVLFKAMQYTKREGLYVDARTVTAQLRKYGRLEFVGGEQYIDHLIDGTPTAAHAESYIQLVLDKWILRRIKDASVAAEDAIKEPDTDPHILLSSCIDRLSSIITERRTSTKQSAWAEVVRDCDNARNGIMPGMMTPWPSFNEGTGGLPFGLVTVFAGRGGTRKSYLVNQLAVFAAVTSKDPIPGGYFPLEDGIKISMRRSACMMAQVNAWHYMRGKITDEEYRLVDDAGVRLINSRLEFRGGRGLNAQSIQLEVARGVAKHGWRFVVVDAFKDIRGGGKDMGVSEVFKSSVMADIAEKHDMAVVVVHHIRKNVGSEGRVADDEENKRITLQDIKGRGEITDDARMVNILQSKQRRSKITGGMELYDFELDVLKNSHGPIAKVNMTLDADIGLFTERR